MSDSGKICVLCKKDCDGQPRTKDSQGRYFHRTCYDAARQKVAQKAATPAKAPAARSAPRPAAPKKPPAPPAVPTLEPLDDDFVPLDDFVPARSENSCPSCSGPLDPSAMICIGCGYNRVTGQRVAGAFAAPPPVKVEAAKPGKAAKSSGGGGGGVSFIKQPWVLGVASIIFFAIMGMAARGNEEMIAVYEITQSIYGLAVWVAVVVIAFQEGGGTGIFCVICGLYHLIYGLLKQDNAYVKWAYGACLFAALVGWAVTGEHILSRFQ